MGVPDDSTLPVDVSDDSTLPVDVPEDSGLPVDVPEYEDVAEEHGDKGSQDEAD